MIKITKDMWEPCWPTQKTSLDHSGMEGGQKGEQVLHGLQALEESDPAADSGQLRERNEGLH